MDTISEDIIQIIKNYRGKCDSCILLPNNPIMYKCYICKKQCCVDKYCKNYVRKNQPICNDCSRFNVYKR